MQYDQCALIESKRKQKLEHVFSSAISQVLTECSVLNFGN